jgi:sugar/nucleoside kinase (ribokinase family)
MIVVIGTTTVDLFIGGVEQMPQFDGDEFTSSSLAFCNRPLTMTLGGNGANSAYVLAALGAPVALCSATGLDEMGETVTGWLAEKGIDLRGFLRREAASATTTTIMDDQLNRISFYYPGIFPTLGYADLPASVLAETDTILITGYPLLPGFRLAGCTAALKAARKNGAITALDIGPAIGQPACLDEIAPLLPLVDYLITNEYELGVCTDDTEIASGAAALVNAGAQTVVVKQGRDGVTIHRADETTHVAGFPVRAEVTVGAGDSFNAGFLYAVRAGMSLPEAARFANATAALVVQTGRSVLGAPTLNDVHALLEANPA